MPRTRAGTPPSYRLHKPSGQAVVTIAGHDHYLGPFGSEASKTKYADLLASKSPPGGTTLTLRSLYDRWLACTTGYAPSTIVNARYSWRRILDRHGADLASTFDRKKLALIRDEMISEGMCRSTINRYVGFVKAVFNWSIEDGRSLVPEGIVANLSLLKNLKVGKAKESPPVRPVSLAHVEATIRASTGILPVLIRIHFLTGARSGELLPLTWESIDRSEPVWRAVLLAHKTRRYGKGRTLLFGPRCQSHLIPILKPNGLIFPNRRGKPFDRHSYCHRIGKVCEMIGIPHWHPHQLRHTHATLVRSRFGLEGAQVALGHSNASITELYAERDMSLAEKIARELG